jgi:TetR/AcrR family transcriptional regulator, mexJK operon transcriptional repressor
MPSPGETPTPRHSAAKHAAILDAAVRVFLQEGYDHASIDKVAAAAGVAKQTVYSHFGSKEQLFLATVDAARSAGRPAPGDQQEMVAVTGDPLTDLTAAGEHVLHAVLAPDVAALHRLTIAELTNHPELQRYWRDHNEPQEAIEDIAGYLAGRDAAGVLSVPDPLRAARHFSLLLATEGRVRSLYGTQPLDEAELRQTAAEVADLIVRAHRP